MKTVASICLFFLFHVGSTQGQEAVANFFSNTLEGCIPLDVDFYDSTDGVIDSLSWYFEGGAPATSTSPNPIVTFHTPGTFLAELTVYANGTETRDSAYIKVREARPEPKFKLENNGLAVSFENQTELDVQFQWDFGDGKFSSEKNPVHSYDHPGVYIVKLRATNECDAVEHADVVVLDINHQAPTYTANDLAEPYDGYFRPGVNLGYFPPWNDRSLADIAAGRPDLDIKGAGVKSIRPGLFDSFIQQFGWDARISTYEHFDDVGLEDNTLIVGFPAEEHRDTNFYCNEHQSELFADLYEPIWDNGENGTPINDENDYAVYLYKLVNLKKDYIKFWEIWNEPGFDFTNVTGYLPPGVENNWWENNPDPCDYKLRAPIFHYVRILRISYEIIKAVDPDSYVTLAAVGYPSFLDAVLRNSDNPVDGSLEADFPLKGGAYFDAIGIHTYPHFDGTLRKWDNDNQEFIHFRHTDKAITSIPVTKSSFETVLENYGYDGTTYPEKEWIITEINVPRKAINEYIGSEEAQINFLMKSFVECTRSGIQEMFVFDIAESHYYEEAVTEFQMMGFYQRLYSIFPYDQIINNGAMAFKTMSDQLFRASYDEAKTAQLNLPAGTDGAAFLNIEGQYVYVLWAQTTEDMSEEAEAFYSFPSSFNINALTRRAWDASYSEQSTIVGAENIQLTGTPIILTDEDNLVPIAPTAFFSYEIGENCQESNVSFFAESTSNTDEWFWEFPGGTPATSNDPNPTVIYETSGVYEATLTVSNAQGSKSTNKTFEIEVNDALPIANFSYSIYGALMSLNNESQNATSYIWDMGDSNIFTGNNPSHTFATPGYFTITLYAINDCDTSMYSEDIIVLPDLIVPRPDFTTDVLGGCPGQEIKFFDGSSSNTDEWYWILDGATPSISAEQNPVVVYDEVGSFDVSLIAANVAGSMTKYRAGYITISEAPQAEFSQLTSGAIVELTNLSSNGLSYFWDFGDGNTSAIFEPTHAYSAGGNYTISLEVRNHCDTSEYQLNVYIEGYPTSSFEIEENLFCQTAELELQSESLGTVDSLRWITEGAAEETSTEATFTAVYNEPGFYEISLITYNQIGSDTAVSYIQIFDEATADFEYDAINGAFEFTNLSLEAQNFYWSFGDGNFSQAESPTHIYAENGIYQVQLVAENTCGSDTTSATIDFTSSLVDLKNIEGVKIYPNPSTGNFTVFGPELSGKVSLRITDALGQVLHREILLEHGGRLSHNIYPKNLKAGIYIITIENGIEHLSKKLIIQ